MQRAMGEGAAADGDAGRRRHRQQRSSIWGKWPWGRKNRAIKSEVAVARSWKCATATLAIALVAKRATAKLAVAPVRKARCCYAFLLYFYFSFVFLHIFFFSFPFSISFIFLYFSICFSFYFPYISSSDFPVKHATTTTLSVACFP